MGEGTNRKIAKNTMYLYLRMLLSMAVSLYTSRVILNTLGLNDFGLYTVVGGVVSLFAFFNSAMSSATQRFLSFEIGKKDWFRLGRVFNVSLVIHIGIAVLIFVLAETIGLWFVNHKLNMSSKSEEDIWFIFQFSILTSIVSITQVPFIALITAREKMSIFALFSIAEVLLKLIIVFLLKLSPYDKLRTYSVLFFIITLLLSFLYRLYCSRSFPESKFKFYYEKGLFREMLSYSGWNLFGNAAAIARGQGINMLLNVFFGTLLNAAYGIMMQVQNTINVFVTNFQMAVSPQIIKSYAKGEYNKLQELVFQSSKYSYFLMYILICPVIYNIDFLLHFWLKTPPPYTSQFVILSIIALTIDCISGPLMKAVQATGKVKWYQIILGSFIFLNLPISYFLFRTYPRPDLFLYVLIIINFISLVFRILYIGILMPFSAVDYVKKVITRIIALTIIGAIPLHYIVYPASNFTDFLITSVLITVLTILLIWFLGFDKTERNKINDLIYEKFLKKYRV